MLNHINLCCSKPFVFTHKAKVEKNHLLFSLFSQFSRRLYARTISMLWCYRGPTFRSLVCLSTNICTLRLSSFCAALAMTCFSAADVISARNSNSALLRAWENKEQREHQVIHLQVFLQHTHFPCNMISSSCTPGNLQYVKHPHQVFHLITAASRDKTRHWL